MSPNSWLHFQLHSKTSETFMQGLCCHILRGLNVSLKLHRMNLWPLSSFVFHASKITWPILPISCASLGWISVAEMSLSVYFLGTGSALICLLQMGSLDRWSVALKTPFFCPSTEQGSLFDDTNLISYSLLLITCFASNIVLPFAPYVSPYIFLSAQLSIWHCVSA